MKAEALLLESVERVLADSCSHEAVRDADSRGITLAAWKQLAAMGVPWISLPEELGGSGGSLWDVYEVLKLCARHAASVPLAEAGILGGWLLIEAGMEVDQTCLAVPNGSRRDWVSVQREGDSLSVSARLHRVAWAREGTWLVIPYDNDDTSLVMRIPMTMAAVTQGSNIAAEARDNVAFDGIRIDPQNWRHVPGHRRLAGELRIRGILSRLALITGATDRVVEMTVAYAGERQQFGRRISSFQAVSQQLAVMVAEAAALALASDAAVAKYEPGRWREIAAAKVIAGRAIALITKSAHQVHGAIGLTKEYDLQLYSRRLWAWRMEYGSGREHAAHLGHVALSEGSQVLWTTLTRP